MWVCLWELAEIIGQSPQETWANFFWLSKDAAEMETLTWSPDLNLASKAGEAGPDFDDSVFVPAGWANDVLAAHAAGYVRVMPVSHEHLGDTHDCPEGTLACRFNGSDFTAAVGVRV